ncbi:MAG: TonB family protein [Bryobacteraceae bacterium]
MAAQIDILDERDPLGGPLIWAVSIHLLLAVAFLIYGYWLARPRQNLGSENAGGAAFSVSSVKSIPIPRREAPPNPVANDSQSNVPSAPAPKTVQKAPDKAEIELPDKMAPKKTQPKPQVQQRYVPPAPANQVYSRTRQAVSSPMYGGPAGAGQIGVGPNTPLGANNLGWYAELVRQRLAQNWRTNGLGNAISPSIVNFTILRDGTIRDVKLFQGSGNPTVDNTALRAVYDSNPLPALPPQVSGNSLPAQFTFQLR